MAPLLVLIFFVLPIAEIAVLVSVGQAIGVVPTILALVAISITGAILAKREGAEVWRRFRHTLGRGQVPSKEIVDGMLVLLGGALLLTPGFITDVLGLILLVPQTRSLVRRGVVRGSGWWIGHHFGLGRFSKHPRRVVAVASMAGSAGAGPRSGTSNAEVKVKDAQTVPADTDAASPDEESVLETPPSDSESGPLKAAGGSSA
jgi:UPF0716 protein FxsA